MTELTARLRECTDYERKHGRVMDQAFLDKAADEIDRLNEDVERLEELSEGLGAIQAELAREQAKADALAEAVKYNLISLRAVNAGANYRNEIEPIPPETVEELEAALTTYQNKELIQGEVGKEIPPEFRGGDDG